MARYRKRPVEVEAVRWTGQNIGEIADVTAESRDVLSDPSSSFLFVNTPDGRMRCPIGFWLVKGPDGKFRSYDDDTFQANYEVADVLQGA